MVRHRMRRLSLMVGAVMLLTIPGVPEAVAHEFAAGSNVNLGASRKNIRKGKRVTLSGRVQSAEPECRNGRKVLITGGRISKTLRTNQIGAFSVRVRPVRTASYTAQIPAIVEGTHPHSHICGGDVSNTVRVRVRPRRG